MSDGFRRRDNAIRQVIGECGRERGAFDAKDGREACSIGGDYSLDAIGVVSRHARRGWEGSKHAQMVKVGVWHKKERQWVRRRKDERSDSNPLSSRMRSKMNAPKS